MAQTLIARLKATEFLPNSWLFEVWVLTSTTHRALRGQPHRSSALDGGRCCRRFDSGTHAWCGHATVMVLWSHQPQGHACAAAPALRGTLIHKVPRKAKNVLLGAAGFRSAGAAHIYIYSYII